MLSSFLVNIPDYILLHYNKEARKQAQMKAEGKAGACLRSGSQAASAAFWVYLYMPYLNIPVHSDAFCCNFAAFFPPDNVRNNYQNK